MIDLIKVRGELEPESNQVNQGLVNLQAFQITDEPGLIWATDMLRTAKSRSTELESKRKEITGPINQAKRAVDALFNPVIDLYEQAERTLKQKIADYTNRVEEQRRAIMVQSAEEYQAGGTPIASIPEPVQVAGVSVAKIWDYEITDSDQVSRLLCSPDPSKIRAFMSRSDMTQAEANGIRFFQKDRVAVRGTK